MKLVITYDVNVDAIEKEYREDLEYSKEILKYCEEDISWMNFEEYIKMICFENYSVGELENYKLIDNCKMELKNEEEV